MDEGATYDVVWSVDGRERPEYGYVGETWALARDGRNFYACTPEGVELQDGFIEVVLWVEDVAISTAATWMGGNHPESSFTFRNESATEICFAFLAPFEAEWWGPDRLRFDTLPEGGSVSFPVASGRYAIRLEDCDGDPLVDGEAVTVTDESTVYTYE
jgi:hypothetical protein